jgi:primosomal replication protein N
MQHQSWQTINGHTQRVDCAVRILAAGELAGQLASLPPGQEIVVTGCLSRPSPRSSHVVVWIVELASVN